MPAGPDPPVATARGGEVRPRLGHVRNGVPLGVDEPPQPVRLRATAAPGGARFELKRGEPGTAISLRSLSLETLNENS